MAVKTWTFYRRIDRTTVVSIIQGEYWIVARAYLHPRDAFVRKRGRAIALARLSNLMESCYDVYRNRQNPEGNIIFYRIRIEDLIQGGYPGVNGHIFNSLVSPEEYEFFMGVILPTLHTRTKGGIK